MSGRETIVSPREEPKEVPLLKPHRRTAYRFILITIMLFFAVLTPAANSKAAEQLLARVGDGGISLTAFQAELSRRGGPLSTKSAVERKAELLEEMLRTESLHAAAVAAGLQNDPEIRVGIRRLLIGRYRQQQLEPLLAAQTVSEQEVESYYREQRREFAIPATVRAAVIQVKVPRRASAAKRAKLRERIESARAEALKLPAATVTFGSVAVRYSDDQASRYRGGNTGWLKAGLQGGHWPAAILAAIFALEEPGQLSAVIDSEDGHYLVKLLERKEGSFRPFSEVRGWCRNKVLQGKRAQEEKIFYAALQQRIPVSVDSALLDSVQLPSTPRPPALPRR